MITHKNLHKPAYVRTKETRLDPEESDLVNSPSRSLREKITDYFGYSETLDYTSVMASPDSPEMPVLVAEVPLDARIGSEEAPESPPQLSDGEGSEQSCGNSDSGKENEEEEISWRPGKSEASQAKLPLQQSQPVAAGRVTRSASGKVPLSLKSCENLQNELNSAEVGSITSKEIPSPPTPHKIIRVKEPGLCAQSLNKLKSISLTPKKSTKTSKQSKR